MSLASRDILSSTVRGVQSVSMFGNYPSALWRVAPCDWLSSSLAWMYAMQATSKLKVTIS